MSPYEEAILNEQASAQQRVVDESHQLVGVVDSLVEKARAIVRQRQEAAERSHREGFEQRCRNERQYLIDAVKKVLGIDLDESLVKLALDENDSKTYTSVTASVEIDGLTFRRGLNGGGTYLVLRRKCSRCGEASWKNILDITYFADLQETWDHSWNCTPEPEVEPEPEYHDVTDAEQASEPAESVAVVYVDPFTVHRQAAERYRETVKLRRELEFKRPIEKAAAIKRLIDSQQAKSATAAKEMSHEDPDFAQFCQTLTDTVIAEMEARETLFVARKNAGISGAGASSASDEEESA